MAYCTFFPAINPLSCPSLTKSKPFQPLNYSSNPNPQISNFVSFNNKNKSLKSSRLGVSCRRHEANPKYEHRVSAVLGLGSGDSEELETSSTADAAVTIDLKLPRRSLQVQFSCDACGETTKKLINRLAYERGTVFVQCSGCLQYHKLIDNLGLVVEYDFRDEIIKQRITTLMTPMTLVKEKANIRLNFQAQQHLKDRCVVGFAQGILPFQGDFVEKQGRRHPHKYSVENSRSSSS